MYSDYYPTMWGASSSPIEAARRLQLEDHLEAVPENGLVVDLGAGIVQSLAAAIYLARPDITVVNIDPGYSLGEEASDEELRADIIGDLPPQEAAVLTANDSWHRIIIAGEAERLPLQSGAADLVVSHAAIGEYTDAESFNETVRILKPGANAVLGPMSRSPYLKWQAYAQAALDDSIVTAIDTEMRTIDVSGNLLEAGFVTLTK